MDCNSLKKLVFMLPVLGLFACTTRQSETEDNPAQSEQATARQQTPAVKIQDDALNAIYPHYLKLTEALVNGNSGEVKLISSNIEAGATQVKGSSALHKYAQQILAAPNLPAQRAAFSKLSDEYITLVKKAGVKNGKLYPTFCPMANNNNGAFWLSASKEIRNPYFGKEMLSCGTVEETINDGGAKTAL